MFVGFFSTSDSLNNGMRFLTHTTPMSWSSPASQDPFSLDVMEFACKSKPFFTRLDHVGYGFYIFLVVISNALNLHCHCLSLFHLAKK